MAAIVNLRQARKRKQQNEKKAVADRNRVQHGRSASEKKETAGLQSLAERRLDGHRRRPSKEDGGER